jgi:hypothetical protein
VVIDDQHGPAHLAIVPALVRHRIGASRNPAQWWI